jgi:hypothetical protein
MVKNMVPGRGLEPPWITPLAPKASASANFATPACSNCTLNGKFSGAPRRIRTFDQSLKRRVLYQLSYGRNGKNVTDFSCFSNCARGGNRTHMPNGGKF